MNTEGDDIITDDHIMRGETGAGAAGVTGRATARPAGIAGPRRGDAQGGAATLKVVAAAARQAGG